MNNFLSSLNRLKNIRLIIRDVGHGNFNEIQMGNATRIIYDIGADKYYKDSQLRSLTQGLNFTNNEEVLIVISHWDVDHYHGLLGFSDNQLKKIKGIIAPEKIPATNTSQKIISLINNHKIPLTLLSFGSKLGKCRGAELTKYWENNNIEIYRSTYTRSRNLDSIVVIFKVNNKAILLCGDHNYNKLYNCVVTNIPQHDYIFVLPHHGGDGGKLDVNDWGQLSLVEVIISFNESNFYGHPQQAILSNIQNLLGQHLYKETNGNGDVIINI